MRAPSEAEPLLGQERVGDRQHLARGPVGWPEAQPAAGAPRRRAALTARREVRRRYAARALRAMSSALREARSCLRWRASSSRAAWASLASRPAATSPAHAVKAVP